jgi:hypothetical protein
MKVLFFLWSRNQRLLSIISGSGAAIWSETNFGLLATITLEVMPFRAYAPFPVPLPF